jgi:hypothetical protein
MKSKPVPVLDELSGWIWVLAAGVLIAITSILGIAGVIPTNSGNTVAVTLCMALLLGVALFLLSVVNISRLKAGRCRAYSVTGADKVAGPAYLIFLIEYLNQTH